MTYWKTFISRLQQPAERGLLSQPVRSSVAAVIWGRGAQERLSPARYDAHIQKARLLTAIGKNDQAMRLCDEAMRSLPDRPTAYAVQAKLFKRLQQPALAMEAYETATTCPEPLDDPYKVYKEQGDLLREQGFNEKALEAYNNALGCPHKPKDVFYVLHRKSQLLNELSFPEEALAVCVEALEAYHRVFYPVVSEIDFPAFPEQLEAEIKQLESQVAAKKEGEGMRLVGYSTHPFWQQGRDAEDQDDSPVLGSVNA